MGPFLAWKRFRGLTAEPAMKRKTSHLFTKAARPAIASFVCLAIYLSYRHKCNSLYNSNGKELHARSIFTNAATASTKLHRKLTRNWLITYDMPALLERLVTNIIPVYEQKVGVQSVP